MIVLQNFQNELHKAVWDWLYDGDNNITKLSFILSEYDNDGNIKPGTQINIVPETIGNTEILQAYLDGSAYMKYVFVLQQYASLTTENNNTANIRTTKIFEDIAVWIEDQKTKGLMPKFPEGTSINSLFVHNGSIAGVDEVGAKYQMFITIEFLCKRKGVIK